MRKKSFIFLFIGTILTELLIHNFVLPSSFAQENYPFSLAQSNSRIQVEDIKGFKGVIVTLGVSPDNKTLIVASNDGQITAIDKENLEVKYTQRLRANPYSDISFTSDSQMFAVPSKERVFVYETNTGKLLQTLRGHSGNISGVAISPDNRIVVSVSGEDWTVKVWDLKEGKLIEDIGEDVGPVTTVAISPHNDFFVTGSIGNERVIQFWDTESFQLLNTSPKQPGYINSLAFTPDGKKLVAAVRNYIKVWDLNTNQEIISLKGPQLELNQVAVSPDNRLAATANREGTIMIIDLNQGTILGILEGHKGWVQSVTFSPDGQTLYSGAEDKIVKVWDLSNF